MSAANVVRLQTAAMRATATTRVTVEALDKRFKTATADVVAVDNVSFEVKQGEFVALLGPSGCGKSTILNMVAGLLPKSGGRIRIDADEVVHGAINRKVGYVFQRDTVFPWRTVEANIGYGLEIAGIAKPVRAEKVARAALFGPEALKPLLIEVHAPRRNSPAPELAF